ncbi:MAG: pH regulation protein F [Bacteriovoracaceae bacterium]|nr:pH regulation protein F [Bacteriovoracaceae bacterium]
MSVYLLGTIYFLEIMLFIGMILCFIRLIKSTLIADKVVALDLISTIIVGVIALEAITTNQVVFLKIAAVIALLSFLGNIAFAKFIGTGGR